MTDMRRLFVADQNRRKKAKLSTEAEQRSETQPLPTIGLTAPRQDVEHENDNDLPDDVIEAGDEDDLDFQPSLRTASSAVHAKCRLC